MMPKPNPASTLRHFDLAPLIAEFNARYVVVNENGRAIVYEPTVDPILGRRQFDRITFEDFQRLYLNRTVEVGLDAKGNPVRKNVAAVWLQHPDRRQFINGVRFDPTGAVSPGVLNLWEGFAVRSVPGDWSLLRRHMLMVLCSGEAKHFEYLIGWLARLVQRPAEQGEVAVVMKGGEGTGKGTLAKALLKILGQHGLAIANAKHLVGNFNGHLRDAILLFADEAFFAGDRAHVGTLKSLITEPYLTVEAKFQNATQMPNFLHIIMASNDDWVVPASLDARRFFVLDVPDTVKGDHTYFARIWAQMEAGGYGAMLNDLLSRDVTHFNVRAVPQTIGLQQQRHLSLPTSEAWWLDVLHRGYVMRSKLGLDEFFGDWHSEVSTEVLYASYADYAAKVHERRPMAREAFGRFMVRVGAEPTKLRNAVVGERISDIPSGQYGDTTRKANLAKKQRATGYKLGSLIEARKRFSEATQLPQAWPDDGDDTP